MHRGQARESLLVPQRQARFAAVHVPSSFGSVHCYKTLAMALRDRHPVKGVVCRALLGAGREVPEWDDMVAEYAEQLLQEHPKGFQPGGMVARRQPGDGCRGPAGAAWAAGGLRRLDRCAGTGQGRSVLERDRADAGGSPEPIRGRDAGGTARCHVSGAAEHIRTGLVIDLLRRRTMSSAGRG